MMKDTETLPDKVENISLLYKDYLYIRVSNQWFMQLAAIPGMQYDWIKTDWVGTLMKAEPIAPELLAKFISAKLQNRILEL